MIALVIVAPSLAAIVTTAFRPLQLRRAVRVMLAALAAAGPLTLVGRVDGLSLLFAGVVSLIGLLATIFSTGMFSIDWGRGQALWTRKSIYFLLLGGFWSAMLLVVLASDFGMLWFGISATTLVTAFLVGFSGDASSLEAAWKYLVLCSIGIGLALLGIVLLGRVSVDAGVDPAHALAWGAMLAHPSAGTPLGRLATVIMLLGFATKAGLVPMHAWLPDAHSKAPAPISGLLSGVLVSCSLYAVIRTENVASAFGVLPSFERTLTWLGVASILVAGSLLLAQRDLKRLLAYSTIEHAGIVALALGFGGPLGTFAALFHIVAHACAKSSAFFAAGLVQSERNTSGLADLRGLWQSSVAGKFLLGALVALGGMPPFGVFVSELLVVAAGIVAHQWIALGLALCGMLLAFTALARVAIETEGGNSKGIRIAPLPRFSIAAAAMALVCAFGLAALPWTPAGGELRIVAATIGVR